MVVKAAEIAAMVMEKQPVVGCLRKWGEKGGRTRTWFAARRKGGS